MNDQDEKESIRSLLLPLFKLIPTFSGEPQDLRLFIKSVNAARVLAAPQMKTTMLEIIKAKISGPAGKLLRNKEFTEWEQIKECLISEFGPVEESVDDSDAEELAVKPDSTQDNLKGRKAHKKDSSGPSKSSEYRSSKSVNNICKNCSKCMVKDKNLESEKRKNKKETVKVENDFAEIGIQTEELKAFRDRETQTIAPKVKIFKEQQTQTDLSLPADEPIKIIPVEKIKSENSDVQSIKNDKAKDEKNEESKVDVKSESSDVQSIKNEKAKDEKNEKSKVDEVKEENPMDKNTEKAKCSMAEDFSKFKKRLSDEDLAKVKSRSISNSKRPSSDQNSEKSKYEEDASKSENGLIANDSSKPRRPSSNENVEKNKIKDSTLKSDEKNSKAQVKPTKEHSKPLDEQLPTRKESADDQSKPHSAKERSKSRTRSTEGKGSKSRTASPNRKQSPKPLMDMKTRSPHSEKSRSKPLMEIDTRPVDRSRSPRSEKRPLMDIDTRSIDRSHSPESKKSKSRPKPLMETKTRPIDVVHSGHSSRDTHSRKSKPLSPSPTRSKRSRADYTETKASKYCKYCEYCQKRGHLITECWLLPPICQYCGVSGHSERKCATKAIHSLGNQMDSFSNQGQNSPWTFSQDALLSCYQNNNNFRY